MWNDSSLSPLTQHQSLPPSHQLQSLQHQGSIAATGAHDDVENRDGPGAPTSAPTHWSDTNSLAASALDSSSANGSSLAAQSTNLNALADAVDALSAMMLGNAAASAAGSGHSSLLANGNTSTTTNARVFSDLPMPATATAQFSHHTTASFQQSAGSAQAATFLHHHQHEHAHQFTAPPRHGSLMINNTHLPQQPLRRLPVNQDVRLEQKNTYAAPLPPHVHESPAPPAVSTARQPSIAEMYAARRTLGFEDRPISAFTHWQQDADGAWILAPPPAVVDEPPRGHYWTVLEETAKQSQPSSSKPPAAGTGTYLSGGGGSSSSRNFNTVSKSQASASFSESSSAASSSATSWACGHCSFINSSVVGACKTCGVARVGAAGSPETDAQWQSWLKSQNSNAIPSHSSAASAAASSASSRCSTSSSASGSFAINDVHSGAPRQNCDPATAASVTAHLIESAPSDQEPILMPLIETPKDNKHAVQHSPATSHQLTIEHSGGLAKLASTIMQLQFSTGVASPPRAAPQVQFQSPQQNSLLPVSHQPLASSFQQPVLFVPARASVIADAHGGRRANKSESRHESSSDSVRGGAWSSSVPSQQRQTGHYFDILASQQQQSLQPQQRHPQQQPHHHQPHHHQPHHHQPHPVLQNRVAPMHQSLNNSFNPFGAYLTASLCNYCRNKSCLTDPHTGMASLFCSDQCAFAALR